MLLAKLISIEKYFFSKQVDKYYSFLLLKYNNVWQLAEFLLSKIFFTEYRVVNNYSQNLLNIINKFQLDT